MYLYMSSITPLKCRILLEKCRIVATECQILGKMPDSSNRVPDMTEKIPDKHRRARVILLNMVKDGYLRKEGAERSTIYLNENKSSEGE